MMLEHTSGKTNVGHPTEALGKALYNFLGGANKQIPVSRATTGSLSLLGWFSGLVCGAQKPPSRAVRRAD